MGIFQPSWQNKNKEKRIKSLNNIFDINKLLYIIDTSEYFDVKEFAVNKINDDNILKELFIKTKNDWLKKIIIDKITDTNILKTLLDKSIGDDFKLIIYEKLGDQQAVLFTKIKNADKKCKHEEYLKYLIELTDENYLSKLAEDILARFEYGTKYISKLLLEKQAYTKFCKIIWEGIFKKMTRTVNQYGAPICGGASAVSDICLYFKNLPWVENCPLGFANYIITHGDYTKEFGGIVTIQESISNNICYILKTLYRNRKDFREEISDLNGYTLYKGKEVGCMSFGGYGDDEAKVFVDASPPCILHIIKLNENEINVYISNE
jgi:hypothetical protein